MTEPAEKEPFKFQALERVAVRMRDSQLTQSAWRMIVDSDHGAGAITLIDHDGHLLYRGDGIFLGRSQEEMRGTWERLERPADEPSVDFPQLG